MAELTPCKVCKVPQPEERYGRTRNGGRRATCSTCCGLSIALGQERRGHGGRGVPRQIEPPRVQAPEAVVDEPMFVRGSGQVPYVRSPRFDPELTTLLDNLTCTWGTHGETR